MKENYICDRSKPSKGEEIIAKVAEKNKKTGNKAGHPIYNALSSS